MLPVMPIQVIDSAVRILRIVARTGPSSLTRISSESRLPVPTVARILQSLADNGILRRLDDKTYHLGARLVPPSTQAEPFRRPLEIAHPIIEGLSRVTREDCGLAVLQGKEAVVVDWCYGPRPRIIEPHSREIPPIARSARYASPTSPHGGAIGSCRTSSSEGRSTSCVAMRRTPVNFAAAAAPATTS